MMTALALFDLDHTLIPLDSDDEWGKFLVRIHAFDALDAQLQNEFTVKNAGFYAQYQQGTLNPVEYLEFMFATLARFPRQQLEQWRSQFLQEVIEPCITQRARDLIQQHLNQHHLCSIVTATNRFITEPIAARFGLELLAPEPEYLSNGNFSGKLRGLPCFGAHKITHVEAWLKQRGQSFEDFAQIFFYSDSQNDLPLLSKVSNPVATNPNHILEQHARAQGWPILNFFAVS